MMLAREFYKALIFVAQQVDLSEELLSLGTRRGSLHQSSLGIAPHRQHNLGLTGEGHLRTVLSEPSYGNPAHEVAGGRLAAEIIAWSPTACSRPADVASRPSRRSATRMQTQPT